MKSVVLPILFLILSGLIRLNAQPCTVLGQTPATAFPVCGDAVFTQAIVPYCGGTPLPGPCSNDGVTDQNPFWYKFTCFTAGTLGFRITPNDLADDYDWQLFDITGKAPAAVFTDATLFVACNWSGKTGITGASAAGSSLQNCAGNAYPLFSSMPQLIQGHEYLLLVSHFTTFSPSQNGYRLSFEGGTAVITDPKIPALQSALSGCGGQKIGVKLNKKMLCNSVATNGTDFTIAGPGLASIVSTEGVGCALGFDTDSLILTSSGNLLPGLYTITAQNGTDGNTLKDICDRSITPGAQLNITVSPIQPVPFDSIKPVGCAPAQLDFVFKQPILCSTIAANGSDFIVTGPTPVTVVSATGNCGSSSTGNVINVKLAGPIQVGGLYRITLQTGSDGNTLKNDCNLETPAGSFIEFLIKDTVSADFSYRIGYSCTSDTIYVLHDGRNGVNRWEWLSDNRAVSNLSQDALVYTQFGAKSIKLRVSNGVCTDSSVQTIVLDNALEAAFTGPDVVCPEDRAQFTDNSKGKIIQWNWDFGNNTRSFLQQPPAQAFAAPTASREMFYTIRLIVADSYNCSDTAIAQLKAVNTCRIAVPNAFTPNNDGRNDFLYPLNAYKADNLIFRIYNRFGQVVFETRDWTRRWDGRVGGKEQPTGTFVWILQYYDRDSGQQVVKKGTTVLIR